LKKRKTGKMAQAFTPEVADKVCTVETGGRIQVCTVQDLIDELPDDAKEPIQNWLPGCHLSVDHILGVGSEKTWFVPDSSSLLEAVLDDADNLPPNWELLFLLEPQAEKYKVLGLTLVAQDAGSL
jgi:hypothetical protein